MVQFHLVPSSTGDWAAHGAIFGRCATKKQTIYGYRLHLPIIDPSPPPRLGARQYRQPTQRRALPIKLRGGAAHPP